MRKTENMMSLMGGALVGAAAMYLLDPDQGRKRREHLKDHAGEYIGSAGEVLQSGFEKVTDQARGVGQTIADKAEDYGQRLSDLAHEYSEKLTEHAKGAGSSWTDRAKDAGASLTDTVDDLRSRGRKLWGRYSGKAQDAAGDASDNISEYGNQLWDQVRGLGKKLSSRGDDAISSARSYVGEEHSSPVLPVTATAIGCCAIGAGLMFLMDPQRGRSRRAWLTDKVTSMVRQTGGSFYQTGKHLKNRASGIAAEAGSRFQSGGGYVSSEQLLQRVRSEMGHLVDQPALIQVLADANGSVTLTGTVASDESDDLIAAIEAIPGVYLVINRLDVSPEPSNPGKNVPNR